MSYYFQPPLFAQPLFLYPPSPLHWQLAPVLLPLPRTVIVPCIRLKVIFHRAGTVLGSNDAVYHSPPSRETLLGNLAWWSKSHGLGDRVYSGQANLYLTSNLLSTLTIRPETGVVGPSNTVRTVSLAEQHSVWEFENMMAGIANKNLGAFLVVDVGAFEQIHRASGQGENNQNQDPPATDQQEARSPDKTPDEDQTTQEEGTGQTQEGNDEPEPGQEGAANG